MARFDDFQVKHWINEAMALATRTVTALERRVEQGQDGMLPGELPDEATEEKVVVGMDFASKEGPSASAFHVKDGIMTPINDVPSKADWWTNYQLLVWEACFDPNVRQSFKNLDHTLKQAALGLLRAKAKGQKPAPREFVVTVDGSELQVQESGPDWHLREAIAHRHLLADTAAAIAVQGKRLDENNARLEGLCKVVEDALAERKDGKANAVSHSEICPVSGQIDVDGEIITTALDAFHDGIREHWAQPACSKQREDRQRLCMVHAIEAAFKLVDAVDVED